MDDPLWRCLNSSNNLLLNRDQIEIAIQKKKINDVFNWFQEHFVTSKPADYIKRCPIVILQGPTGCGKTVTLRWISKELKIPIKEYSETTDLTAINFDLSKSINNDLSNSNGNSFDDDNQKNSSQSIDRRKALKFEHFIINNLRYCSLYPTQEQNFSTGSYNNNYNSNSNLSIPVDSDAEAEFDDEEDLFINYTTDPMLMPKKQLPPPSNGVIIHIETPLSFARYQRILIPTLYRIIETIRKISRTIPRRIAVVFETLEGDCEILTLPSKMKSRLGLQTFKFNPVTKTNMKKLIESTVKQYKNIIFEKETIEQLVNDCDGDIRACLNTLQLICNKSNSSYDNPAITTGILNQQNGINNNYNYHSNSFDRYSDFIHKTSPYNQQQQQANKKIKLNHSDCKNSKPVRLTPNLLRDNTRSTSFFHVLGKIFYQKRLYPDITSDRRYNNYQNMKTNGYVVNEFDRPYPLVNSTEEIVNMLDIEPKNLLTWLHQHYHRFCNDNNISKAALFLENHSIVDTTSLSSTLSTQFYEMHSTLDKLQLQLAIDSTVFSLYEDQSKATPKSSHKKQQTENGCKWIKSSVESSGLSNGKCDDLYSFKKPLMKSLDKMYNDYHNLLDICSTRLFNSISLHVDPTKLLVDYVPYLSYMSKNWSKMSTSAREQFKQSDYNSQSSNCSSKTQSIAKIFDDENLLRLYSTLDKLDTDNEIDYDSRHDQLLELICKVEVKEEFNPGGD